MVPIDKASNDGTNPQVATMLSGKSCSCLLLRGCKIQHLAGSGIQKFPRNLKDYFEDMCELSYQRVYIFNLTFSPWSHHLEEYKISWEI